jgi:hypothetical protein
MASPLSIQRQIANAAAASGQPVTGDLQQLAQLISQLPAADQASYVQSIQQGIQTGQVGQLTQAVLDQMVQQVQPQVQAAATQATQSATQQAATTPAAPTTAPQQATLTGATVTAPSLTPPTAAPAASTTGSSSGVADPTVTTQGAEGAATATSTPTDEDQSAIWGSEYQTSFDTSGPTTPTGPAAQIGADLFGSPSQQLQYLAGYLGVSPTDVQNQYNSYVATLGQGGNGPGQAGRNQSGGTPMPIDQWVASQVTSIEGKYAPILNAYEQTWEQTNNGPMPYALRASLRQSLQNMPPGQQQAADNILYQYLTAWNTAQNVKSTDPGEYAADMQQALAIVHGNFPLLDAVYNNYASSTTPTAGVEANYAAQQKQNFTQTYMQSTGRWPSQQEIDTYGTLPAVEQGQYIDNALMANLPMTYAAYNQTLGLLNGTGRGTNAVSWQQAFGVDPTPEQVYDMSHMNAEDVNAYIDNSPSKEIPGMNIGTYSNLQQVGEDVSTKLFGTSDSSQLIQMFHEANQKT